ALERHRERIRNNGVVPAPLRRRQIYLMHRFEGKSYREIAGELMISPKTVEIQMSKAIQQVKEVLRDKWLLLVMAAAYWL
ncbi:MAG: hypothetical protein J7576_23850, partial [Siphonobacter aquaeclarae]|nr:hypothetical protein [Siphonobacter aquaeclarae]